MTKTNFFSPFKVSNVSMEEIKPQNLPKNIYTLFRNFKNYMNEDNNIYVYGSVQRGDYFHGLSDIDISVFCDNEYSSMNKMQHFFRKEKSDFVKVAWILNGNTIYGYKLKYKVPEKNIKIEFAIFNKKFERIVLPHQKKTLSLPIFIFCLIYLLKVFYYIIPICSKETFRLLKRKIFALMLMSEPAYLVIKETNPRKPMTKKIDKNDEN